MSARREENEWVWLPSYAGFLLAERPQRARILGDGFVEWCVHDCGDEDCREWNTLKRDDGEPLYHVSECSMHDTEKEAMRATKKQIRARRRRDRGEA